MIVRMISALQQLRPETVLFSAVVIAENHKNMGDLFVFVHETVVHEAVDRLNLCIIKMFVEYFVFCG
jgi:hypothetical protein